MLGVQSVECLCSGTGIYFGRPLVGPVMMTELPASKSSLALSRSRSLSRSLRHAGITLAARLSPEEEEEEEEEEEGLFKADAVNEEDPERDRATRRRSLFVFIGYCRGTQGARC